MPVFVSGASGGPVCRDCQGATTLVLSRLEYKLRIPVSDDFKNDGVPVRGAKPVSQSYMAQELTEYVRKADRRTAAVYDPLFSVRGGDL